MNESSKDLNIYAFNALKAFNLELDKNYSHLHSQLIHLEHQIDSGNLALSETAQSLLSIIDHANCLV